MLGARPDDRLAELAEKLRRDGADVKHCRCDIGSAADTAALVDNTLARYGRLDGGFNNARISGGVGRLACGLRSSAGDLGAHRQPDALEVHAGARAIVNTSSVGGLRGGPNLSAYQATKRAVIGLTTTAAHDYGRDGLRGFSSCGWLRQAYAYVDARCWHVLLLIHRPGYWARCSG